MADSMVSMHRYVAPIASATPRASTDFPEPGSPANTTKSVTSARYREETAVGRGPRAGTAILKDASGSGPGPPRGFGRHATGL